MQNCLCAVDSVLWKCCVWQADSGHVTSLAASSVAVAATVQPDNTVLQHEEVQHSSPRGTGTQNQKRGYIHTGNRDATSYPSLNL